MENKTKKQIKKKIKRITFIWIFSDENGKLFPFRSFGEAHKYAFEIYDKGLKFESKINENYFYINSWNSEFVSIVKLDFKKLYKGIEENEK